MAWYPTSSNFFQYFADDCWPLMMEFGKDVTGREIERTPPPVMKDKQFQDRLTNSQTYLKISLIFIFENFIKLF